jgi:hypothetical protein
MADESIAVILAESVSCLDQGVASEYAPLSPARTICVATGLCGRQLCLMRATQALALPDREFFG